MIILSEPYVSDFLKETIHKNKFALIQNNYANNFMQNYNDSFIDSESANIKLQNNEKIYTNSENSISWIENHLKDQELLKRIKIFKNKADFRRLIKPLYPKFRFEEIATSNLASFPINSFTFPFIIKPVSGFFSMGVYKVNNPDEWLGVIENINQEIEETKHIYPIEVVNTEKFIIEEFIDGEEYAFDAYYDSNGEAVLLNAFKHHFSSDTDFSDRVYYTSKKIIEENHDKFLHILQQLGELAYLKDFPLHVEVRVNSKGEVIPIEINPLRFGGWCTTADVTPYAFKFNPYEAFFNSFKPNWNSILKEMSDSLFSIIVLNNSTGLAADKIKMFNYSKLKNDFDNALECREVDYNDYPVFGFLFTETASDNFNELERICNSSLIEYVEKY